MQRDQLHQRSYSNVSHIFFRLFAAIQSGTFINIGTVLLTVSITVASMLRSLFILPTYTPSIAGGNRSIWNRPKKLRVHCYVGVKRIVSLTILPVRQSTSYTPILKIELTRLFTKSIVRPCRSTVRIVPGIYCFSISCFTSIDTVVISSVTPFWRRRVSGASRPLHDIGTKAQTVTYFLIERDEFSALIISYSVHFIQLRAVYTSRYQRQSLNRKYWRFHFHPVNSFL